MAIVYSYPKVTSPLATDVLVLTDTTVTAGKRKNKTKSIAMSDVATYVINSKSGITGSGTVNKFPIFTASTVVGDSIITQAALGQGITVGGNLDVTNDTNLQGSLLADSLEVTNDSVFTGSARFNGTIKDTSGGVGTNGQVLTSTGTGVAWATDAGGSVTGTGTTNYIAKWNTSSSIQDSIIFDNGASVGIGTNSPNFLLDVEAQGANMRVFNLTSNADTDIYFRTTGTTGRSRILFGDSADPSIGNIIYRHTNDSLAFTTNNSEKMRVLSNGNVGIGTNFPTEKLDIYSDGNAVIRLESGGGGVGMLDVGIDFTINNTINTNLIFKTSNVERMRITNTGNVGIGTTNASELLHVQGNNATIQTVESGGATVKMRSGSVGRFGTYSDNNLLFVSNSQDRMTITSGGNVGIGTTSPVSIGGHSGILTLYGSNATALALKDAVSEGHLRFDDSNFKFTNSGGTVRMQIEADTGNVGIGTTSPASKLTVTSGDAEVTGSDKGLILESPNGTRYRIQVDNSGNLTTTAV
jgi:hypothetical protein